MKNSIIIFLLLNSIYGISQALVFEWAKGFGSVGQETARDITTDQNGNVFTIGSFTNTIDFDPSSNTFNLTPIGAGDTYITKYNKSGTFIWVKRIGSSGASTAKTYGHSIKIDPSGNILIFGIFSVDTDFDPSPSSSFVYTTLGADTGMLFITKLDNNGNFVWAKRIENYGYPEDFPGSMALDAAGNIYITGSFWETIDFDPNPSAYYFLESHNLEAAFLLKLNNNGGFVFAKAFKQQETSNNFQNGLAKKSTLIDQNYVKAYKIIVGKSGHIYIYGQFIGTVQFNSNSNCPPCYPDIVLSTAGNNMFLPSNRFLVKLSSQGVAIFAKKIEQEVKVNDFEVNSAGSIYLAGSFAGSFAFNLDNPYPNNNSMSPIGNKDIFVMKYNSSGTFEWAKKYGSMGGHAYAANIITDLAGNLFIQGGFSNNLDFDNNPSTTNTLIKSNLGSGSDDYFFTKLDASGNFLSANSIGTNNEYIGLKLHIDNLENIYTTGVFEGTNTQNLISNGFLDSFIHKFSTNKYTVKSGNWIDPTVWSQSVIPALNEGVIIEAGHIITLNNLVNVKKIFNKGTIQLGNAGQLKLNNP
jgi:Beta-propeller repeat